MASRDFFDQPVKVVFAFLPFIVDPVVNAVSAAKFLIFIKLGILGAGKVVVFALVFVLLGTLSAQQTIK